MSGLSKTDEFKRITDEYHDTCKIIDMMHSHAKEQAWKMFQDKITKLKELELPKSGCF